MWAAAKSMNVHLLMYSYAVFCCGGPSQSSRHHLLRSHITVFNFEG